MSAETTDNSRKLKELENIKSMLKDKIDHICESIVDSNFQSEKDIEFLLSETDKFRIEFESKCLQSYLTLKRIEEFLKQQGVRVRIEERNEYGDKYEWRLSKAHREDLLITFNGSGFFLRSGGWCLSAFGLERVEDTIWAWKEDRM